MPCHQWWKRSVYYCVRNCMGLTFFSSLWLSYIYTGCEGYNSHSRHQNRVLWSSDFTTFILRVMSKFKILHHCLDLLWRCFLIYGFPSGHMWRQTTCDVKPLAAGKPGLFPVAHRLGQFVTVPGRRNTSNQTSRKAFHMDRWEDSTPG